MRHSKQQIKDTCYWYVFSYNEGYIMVFRAFKSVLIDVVGVLVSITIYDKLISCIIYIILANRYSFNVSYHLAILGFLHY